MSLRESIFCYLEHKMNCKGGFVMGKMRKYIAAIVVMLFTTVVALGVVSILTYMFKWQADRAMIGIVATYVLAGFAGGIFLIGKRKALGPVILGTVYMLFMLAFSHMGFHITFKFSKRFVLIWLLVVSSAYVGRCIKR